MSEEQDKKANEKEQVAGEISDKALENVAGGIRYESDVVIGYKSPPKPLPTALNPPK